MTWRDTVKLVGEISVTFGSIARIYYGWRTFPRDSKESVKETGGDAWKGMKEGWSKFTTTAKATIGARTSTEPRGQELERLEQGRTDEAEIKRSLGPMKPEEAKAGGPGIKGKEVDEVCLRRVNAVEETGRGPEAAREQGRNGNPATKEARQGGSNTPERTGIAGTRNAPKNEDTFRGRRYTSYGRGSREG